MPIPEQDGRRGGEGNPSLALGGSNPPTPPLSALCFAAAPALVLLSLSLFVGCLPSRGRKGREVAE